MRLATFALPRALLGRVSRPGPTYSYAAWPDLKTRPKHSYARNIFSVSNVCPSTLVASAPSHPSIIVA